MTTLSVAPVSASTTRERVRFRDLLTAEWIKLRSLRSTYWVLGLGALTMISLNVNAAIADYSNWPTYSAATRTNFDPIQDAFSHSAYLLLILAAGSIGAIAIVSEYASGQIRTTFAAVPARRSVIAAKLAVMTVVMFVVGAVIAAVSFGVTQAILSGRHAGASIGYSGAFRALVASALLAPVCALIGIGVGAIIRHTAPTIVTIVVGLDLLPQFFNSERHPWVNDIGNVMPISAWERLRYPGSAGGLHDPTLAGSWVVYVVWPLVAAILAVIVVERRDV